MKLSTWQFKERNSVSTGPDPTTAYSHYLITEERKSVSDPDVAFNLQMPENKVGTFRFSLRKKNGDIFEFEKN